MTNTAIATVQPNDVAGVDLDMTNISIGGSSPAPMELHPMLPSMRFTYIPATIDRVAAYNAIYPITEDGVNDKYPVDPTAILNHVVEHFFGDNLVFLPSSKGSLGEGFLWRGNKWVPTARECLVADFQRLSESVQWGQRAADYIIRSYTSPTGVVFDQRRELIYFDDCVVRASPGGVETLPHHRLHYNTRTLGRNYRPDDRKVSRWLAYLDSLFGSYDPTLVQTVQELFGYCLTSYSLQVFFVLTGGRNTGKSTLMNFLSLLLGGRHVSDGVECEVVRKPKIAKLGGEFGLASVPGASVLLCSEENDSGGRIPPAARDIIKALTGDDGAEINRKHKDEFVGYFNPKIILTTNDPPSLGDDSGALQQRMVRLDFKRSFGRGTTDRTLLRKLWVEERDGITNWAIDGLIKLMLRAETERVGRCEAFTQSSETQLAKQEREENDNLVLQWFRSRIRVVKPKPDAQTFMVIDRMQACRDFHLWMAEEQRVSNVQKSKWSLTRFLTAFEFILINEGVIKHQLVWSKLRSSATVGQPGRPFYFPFLQLNSTFVVNHNFELLIDKQTVNPFSYLAI